jgi:hypothetical protein
MILVLGYRIKGRARGQGGEIESGGRMDICLQEMPKTGRKEVRYTDFRKICSPAGIYCDLCKRMFEKKGNLRFFG